MPRKPGTALRQEFGDEKPSLRSYPYPYRAALAICSDIDETRTADEFLEIQRFLCTKASTGMGEGVGLEIGNSFYFCDDEDDFSLFSSDDRARGIILEFIRAGYIDCLHSYGDAVKHRDEVMRALDVLSGEDCRIDVWINHYGSISNLSRKFEYLLGECSGDDPSSPTYHSDLTMDYGMRFAWVGAVTRIVGQNGLPRRPVARMWSVFNPKQPLHTGLNLVKEVRRSLLAALGDERFQLQSRNELLQPIVLNDGSRLYEFMRYCDHPRGIPAGATSKGLAHVISKRVLKALKYSQGSSIVYTHLGKNGDSQKLIAAETRDALKILEFENRSGQIYVTTTSKLLNYHTVLQTLVWESAEIDGRTQIITKHLDDPVFGNLKPSLRQMQGITFYVADAENCDMYVGGKQVGDLQRNPPDHTGKVSVTIPLTHLSYPL